MSSQAGNMWTMFHFIPLQIATYGCMDFTKAVAMNNEFLQKRDAESTKKLVQATSSDDDSDDSSGMTTPHCLPEDCP